MGMENNEPDINNTVQQWIDTPDEWDHDIS